MVAKGLTEAITGAEHSLGPTSLSGLGNIQQVWITVNQKVSAGEGSERASLQVLVFTHS